MRKISTHPAIEMLAWLTCKGKTACKKCLPLLLLFCIGEGAWGQNINAGNGVNWVGANQNPDSYDQPTNLDTDDYRVMQYRRVSVASGSPTDGRGHWATTINCRDSVGDVFNWDMDGGESKGFLFTSGPSSNKWEAKWNFNSATQANLYAINGVQGVTSGGYDMGIDMSTEGYYTFVLKDAGNTDSEFYVGYTTNKPVTFTLKECKVNPDRSATIKITLSGTPSSEEKFYARYRTTTNDFSASTEMSAAGTILGNEVTITIPTLAAATTVYYYIFSTTLSQSVVKGLSEENASFALLNYVDNSGANYSYITSGVASNPADYFRSVADGGWNTPSKWESSPATDGINFHPATLVPTSSASGITIAAGTVINFANAITIDKTVVNGTLLIDYDGFTLNDGGATDELTINNGGVLQCIVTTPSNTNYYDKKIHYGTSGNINVKPGGTIMIGDGAATHVSKGYSGFAIEPADSVIWNDGAIFEWNTTNSDFEQGVTYFPGAGVGTTPIFRLSAIKSSTSGSGTPLTINGIFEVNTDYTLPGNSTKTFRDGIIGTATLTQAGSDSRFQTGAGAVLGGASLKIILISPLYLSTTTHVPAGGNVTISGGNIDNGGTLTIDGTLDVTDVSFSGNGASNVEVNGTLKTKNVNGIKGTGSTFLSSDFTINDGSTIEFYADAEQIIETSVKYYNITFKGGKKTYSSSSRIKVDTSGTVTISGPNVIVDATNNNLGIPSPNDTKFNMDGGLLLLGTSGTQPNMAGAYNITGGTIQFLCSNTTGQTIRPATYHNIEVIGDNVANSSGYITLNSGGSFTVKSGGIFTINDESIKPADATSGQTVIVEDGATFRVGNVDGFIGHDGSGSQFSAIHTNIPVGSITLAPTSTVEFMRDGDQTTIIGGITYGNVIIDSSGQKYFYGDVKIQGNLTTNAGCDIVLNSTTKGHLSFVGATNQTISGPGNFYLHDVTIANTAGAITSLTDTIDLIDNELNLESGQFELKSGSKMNMSNGSVIHATSGDFATTIGGKIIFRGGTQPFEGIINFYPDVFLTPPSVLGGVNFGPTSFLHNLLEINANGYVDVNSPSFATGSLLKYNTGGNYDRSVEWSNASGNGYPYDVLVTGNTTFKPVKGNNSFANTTFNTAGDVTIDAGSAIYLDNGDANMTVPLIVGGDLLINGSLSGSKAIGGDIKVNGNWTRGTSGEFYGNNRAVFFIGDTNSNLTVNATEHKETFPYLFLEKDNILDTLNLNDSIMVTKQFGIAKGTLTLNSSDVTLESVDTATASMNEMNTDAVLDYNGSGRFIVERYIPEHYKAWQLLAAPTKGSTINAAWQEGNPTGMENNIKPGYGTTITSNLANATSLGFDLYSKGGPSMKTYDAVNNKWVGVPNTINPIDNPNGYMLFVRGDRSVIDYQQPATATTLRTRGKLYAPGTEAPSLIPVPAGQFALIGNPYASAIDFSSVLGLTATSNIDSAYYIWDPFLTSFYGFGAYRTISGNVAVPASGNYVDNNIPPIQSGQAFFVHNESAIDGTISFAESVKVTGSKNVQRGGNGFNKPDAQLRGNLFVGLGGNSVLIDGILTLFQKDYSLAIDGLDAKKMYNPSENMGIASNGQILAIERRPLPGIYDTLFYEMKKLRVRDYHFEFIAAKMGISGLDGFVEDRYLAKKTPLNMAGATIVPFSVDNHAGSYAPDRFLIVFKKAAAGPVPVTLVSARAYAQHNDVVVKWKVANERSILNYEIETSRDGIQFHHAHTLDAMNTGSASYNWLHVKPGIGYHYYRIKTTEIDGNIAYSHIMKVRISNIEPQISIYQNPIKNGTIRLQLTNQKAGIYMARLVNNSGQVFIAKEINHGGGSSTQLIPVSKHMAAGIYHLEITKPDGGMEVLKILY